MLMNSNSAKPKRMELFFIIITISIGLITVLGWFLKKIFDLIFPVFTSNIQSSVWIEYLLIIFIGALSGWIIYVIIDFLSRMWNFKLNKWMSLTIFFWILFSISGILFISSEVGLKTDIKWNLKDLDDNLKFVGTIHCTDENDKWLYEDEEAICKTSIQLKNASGTISFRIKEIQRVTKNLKFDSEGNYRFNTLKDVEHIWFEIYGVDEKGQYRSLGTSWDHTFLNDQIVDKNKQIFLRYLFALFSLVFVLVPTSIASIKNIYN